MDGPIAAPAPEIQSEIQREIETEHLIVGAGVSGLALARRLSDRGRDFCVIEKSKSVGGRVATRRDQEMKFDHGAQFLKIDRQSFGLPGFWSKLGLVKPWFESSGVQHSCCPAGMNSLMKKAAEPLAQKVLLNSRLLILRRADEGRFVAEREDGTAIRAQRVYLTCPLPQTLKILKDSSIEYPSELNDIDYAHALVGLFVLKRENFLHADLAMIEAFKFQERISDSISSVASQWSKGLGHELAFTIVMSPGWSERGFDEEDSLTMAKMTHVFYDFIGRLTKSEVCENQIDRSQLKRWRYSHPLQRANSLHMNIEPGLTLLGDAFGGASINGAIRSAESIDLSHALSRS